ncbi:MAG: hypothetical protein COA69_04080 [Robiginitomaculum sp.]|nr:MAG: hypothetical protein COA69_04080 [Robiginitomaculum sp.]
MNIRQKPILIALSILLIGLCMFAAIKVIKPNKPSLTEATNIEQLTKTSSTPPQVMVAQPSITTTPKDGFGFLYTILVLLTVSLASSIFLIVYLLNWRYRISDTQVSVVPNELLKLLEKQVGGFNQTTHYIGDYIKRIAHDREKTDADIKELQDVFAVFQNSLNKKDQEIERYKSGYDSAIYKKFLSKFTKFYIELKKESHAPENHHSVKLLTDMLEQLEDALLECNVELRTPTLLERADDHKDIIGGRIKTKTTNQPELHGKIAEVLLPAFVLKTQAGDDVLREASIAIYVYEESETT